tara:strand:+ start:121 stop:501 length:381 start_codon:yes stop_codon:yes gene_type:complete
MTYKDIEERRAKARELYHRNPQKSSERNKKKREHKRAILYESLGNKCCQCGSTDRMEIDHINPLHKTTRQSVLSMGIEAAHAQIDNLQLLCYDCHRKRSTAQRKAAYKLLYALPVEEQNRLIQKEL